MESKMYDYLVRIKREYELLGTQLESDDVLSDIRRHSALTKERNAFHGVVGVFSEYLRCETNLLEARKIASSSTDAELLALANAEAEELAAQMKTFESKLRVLLIPADPMDEKNVIMEIRGAAGGDEANIFAGDLFEIYKKWANSAKFQIEILDITRATAGGVSQVVFKVIGHAAYARLKFEAGVHRVQRVPETESRGRVHTSTVTVTVIPEIDDEVIINVKPGDVKVDTFRSSGAGGQSVNTTDSAVRLTHLPTGIVISSQSGRSQVANRETAFAVLRAKLYDLEMKKKREESAAYRVLAGSGARAEKVRTYNYPQDRVTDHRINFSSSLKSIVGGALEEIIIELTAAERLAKLAELNFENNKVSE